MFSPTQTHWLAHLKFYILILEFSFYFHRSSCVLEFDWDNTWTTSLAFLVLPVKAVKEVESFLDSPINRGRFCLQNNLNFTIWFFVCKMIWTILSIFLRAYIQYFLQFNDCQCNVNLWKMIIFWKSSTNRWFKQASIGVQKCSDLYLICMKQRIL